MAAYGGGHPKSGPRAGRSTTATAPPATHPPAELSVAFELAVDLAGHPVLRSHVLDGRAVVPMALHMEWLAHAALHGNPGLVEELGKLLRNSASSLSSTLKDSRDAIEGLNSRARDATEDLPRLGPQTVVHGRTACPLAPNGAPDCKTASDHLCKSKGYKEGKSVDIESAEKCSAKVYLSGRTGAPGECRTENFVTSAVCQ